MAGSNRRTKTLRPGEPASMVPNCSTVPATGGTSRRNATETRRISKVRSSVRGWWCRVLLLLPLLFIVLTVCSTDSAGAKAAPQSGLPSNCRPTVHTVYPRPSVLGIRANYRPGLSRSAVAKASFPAFAGSGVQLCVVSAQYGQHSMSLSVLKISTMSQVETMGLDLRRTGVFSHIDVVLRSS